MKQYGTALERISGIIRDNTAVLPGQPVVELVGDRRVLIENHIREHICHHLTAITVVAKVVAALYSVELIAIGAVAEVVGHCILRSARNITCRDIVEVAISKVETAR